MSPVPLKDAAAPWVDEQTRGGASVSNSSRSGMGSVHPETDPKLEKMTKEVEQLTRQVATMALQGQEKDVLLKKLTSALRAAKARARENELDLKRHQALIKSGPGKQPPPIPYTLQQQQQQQQQRKERAVTLPKIEHGGGMELKLTSQQAPGSKVEGEAQPEAQQIHVALEGRPEQSSPNQHDVEELRSPPAPSKSSPAISFVPETKFQLHAHKKAGTLLFTEGANPSEMSLYTRHVAFKYSSNPNEQQMTHL